MIVAIHQPNYAPWLGFFAKLARADVFVLLDDAQFSKNSYINRVQIDGNGSARWLTVPVRYRFGDPVNRVFPAEQTWVKAHCDALKTFYRNAAAFDATWHWLAEVYARIPRHDLASSNQALIEAVAQRLGLETVIKRASELGLSPSKADDRLVAIVHACGRGAAYLSGRGGAKYQDPAKFATAGIKLVYTDFVEPEYHRSGNGFLPGLSIFNALFHLGERETARLVRMRARAA